MATQKATKTNRPVHFGKSLKAIRKLERRQMAERSSTYPTGRGRTSVIQRNVMIQGAATPMEAMSPKNGIFLKNESFMVVLRVIITFFDGLISPGNLVCHYDLIEIFEAYAVELKGHPPLLYMITGI